MKRFSVFQEVPQSSESSSHNTNPHQDIIKTTVSPDSERSKALGSRYQDQTKTVQIFLKNFALNELGINGFKKWQKRQKWEKQLECLSSTIEIHSFVSLMVVVKGHRGSEDEDMKQKLSQCYYHVVTVLAESQPVLINNPKSFQPKTLRKWSGDLEQFPVLQQYYNLHPQSTPVGSFWV